MKILVVDDNHNLARILGYYLEEQGHHVVPAYDGSLGLLLFEHKHFDVILIDLALPKRSGLELLEHIRQKDCTVRVIIVTGCPDLLKDDSYRIQELDIEAVVEKPFELSDIDEIIQRLNSVEYAANA
jgi:two-component system response regulator TctD